MCSPQKVVIPKGLVNPRETTIIEIPRNLQNVGTVVARPRPVCYSPSMDQPATPKMTKKRTYTRKTYPPRRAPGYGGLDDAGLTFAGIPNDESFQTPPVFKPWYPISPGDRYGEISKGDVSYAVCQPGKAGFDPPLTSSTFREIDDPRESKYSKSFLHTSLTQIRSLFVQRLQTRWKVVAPYFPSQDSRFPEALAFQFGHRQPGPTIRLL